MAEFGEPLSERELEVLQSVAEGAANKEVALILSISQNTVKVHLRNIYAKLGVASRTEAATVAIQKGLVVLPGTKEAGQPAEESANSGLDGEAANLSDTPTAVTQSPSRTAGSRTKTAFILAAAIIIILLGLFGWRTLSAPSTPELEPFVEQPLGESRWLINNRPMAEARAGMAVAAVGLDVYGIGGETAVGLTNTVAVYSTTDHAWREAAAKPTAVADTTAAVLFGEIYVPGGRLADGAPTAVVETYSPANDAWRPVAALPQPVAGGLTLSDGSFLYLFGGWNGDAYLDTAYVYDPGADSWRPLDPMDQPRAFAAGEFVTGQLYVVGGFDGRSELALCQFFDPVAADWHDCPDMLLPRAGAGAAVLLNKLYVLGGGFDETDEVTYSEVYDPIGQTWQVVNTPMMAEALAWTNLGVANVETRIYALGGRRGQEFSDETLVYAPFVYQTFIPAAASEKP